MIFLIIIRSELHIFMLHSFAYFSEAVSEPANPSRDEMCSSMVVTVTATTTVTATVYQ